MVPPLFCRTRRLHPGPTLWMLAATLVSSGTLAAAGPRSSGADLSGNRESGSSYFGLRSPIRAVSGPASTRSGTGPSTAAVPGSYPSSAGVVINEVVARAKEDGTDWIEFFNAGTETVDLSGWTFQDSDGAGAPNPEHLYTFPQGVSLARGQYLVLEESAEGSFDFGLGAEDGLWLSDAAGGGVDSTSWSDGQAPEGSGWSRMTNGLGPFKTLKDLTRGKMNRDEPMGDPQATIYDGNVVRDYNIAISGEYLALLNSHVLEETYEPGYLQFEGQSYGPVGVRYNGNYDLTSCVDSNGQPACEKMPWKISFHEYDDSGRFYTLRKLQFHNMSNDASMMRERMAHGLFEAMGVPTSRVTYVRLHINDAPAGIYALTEQIDGVFTRDRYEEGGEGNLYKEVWPQYVRDDRYLSALETNEDEDPDVSMMSDFALELRRTPVEQARPVLDQYLDMQHMANYIAVDRAINNWDGIMGWYCWKGFCFPHNFYWYEAGDHTRAWLIPWDLDFTLTADESVGVWTPWYIPPTYCGPRMLVTNASCDELIYAFVQTAWSDYVAAAEVLLDGPFAQETLDNQISFLASQLEPLVLSEPFSPEIEGWQAQVDSLREATVTLREKLMIEIATPPPPP